MHMISRGKTSLNDADYYQKYGELLCLLLSLFHSGDFLCKRCNLTFDKDYIVVERDTVKDWDNAKHCIFCQFGHKRGKCDVCGKYFSADYSGIQGDIGIAPKAYPILSLSITDDNKEKLNIKTLENLGTVVRAKNPSNTVRVYLSFEALDSPELARLLNGNTKILKKWKEIFNKNICEYCFPKMSPRTRGNIDLVGLNLVLAYQDNIINNSPYALERVDLVDQEILETKAETIEMLELEVANNDDVLFYMIQNGLSRNDLSTKYVSHTIADVLVARIAENKNSENLVKEANHSRKGGEILVIVPLDEAKETEQSTVEEIANKVLMIVSNAVESIKYDLNVDIDDGFITVTVSFKV